MTIIRLIIPPGPTQPLWIQWPSIRHPASAPGDFYVEYKCCLACGVPQALAPELVGWTDEHYAHCFWKKQPETSAEIEQAIKVLKSQELGCHRYAGTDRSILERLASEGCCDHPLETKSIFRPEPPIDTHPRPPAPPESGIGFWQKFWNKLGLFSGS